MTDQPPPKRVRRRIALLAALGIGLIVVALAVTYAARIPIAMWVAADVLADTPFENATFHLVVLNDERLVLEDLEADYPFHVRAARVVVTYEPLAALDGSIESVTVSGLQATLTPDQLTDLQASDGSSGEPPVAIGRLGVEDGRVSLMLGERQIDLTLNGEFASFNPLAGMFDVAVADPEFRLNGPVTIGSGSGQTGPTVTWRIDGGDVQRDELSMVEVTGQVLVEGPRGDGTGLIIDVSLAAPRAVFRPYDTGPFSLDLEAAVSLGDTPAIDSATATMELGAASGPFHARLTANVRDMTDVTTTARIEIGRDLTIATGPDITFTAPASLSTQATATLPDAWLGNVEDLTDLALTLLTSFSATFQSDGIAIVGYGNVASASGDITLTPRESETTIVIGPDTVATELLVDPDALSAWDVPEDLATVLSVPIDIAIDSGDQPLTLRDLAEGGHMIEGEAGLSLTQTDRSATLRLEGKAQLAPDATLETALVRDAALSVVASSLGDIEGLLLIGSGRAEFSDQTWHAELEIDGTAESAVIDTARIENLALTLPLDATWNGEIVDLTAQPVVLASASAVHVGDARSGPVELDLPMRLTGTPDKFSLYLDDNGWIDLAGLTHPHFVIDQPLSVRLEQMGLPVLTVEFDDDGYPVWDTRLKVTPPSATVTVLGDDGLPAAVVTGTLPKISVHANQLIASYLTATMESSGGSLTWVDQDIMATGLKSLITYNTGLSPWPQLHLEIDAIQDLAAPKRFADFSTDIRIAPVWPQGDDVRLSLNVHAPDRRYALNVEASYQPTKDLATALVRLPPLTFEPGGYQPSDLSPILVSSTKDVSGSIGITGDVTWQSGVWSSDLDVALREISATTYGVRIERLNSLINIDGVMPPSTPPGQLVAIGGIDAGLPLRDALISLSLSGDGTLNLESAEMKFAGGEVTADPLVWHLESDPEPLNLHVTGVDVGALFALAELDDLTATGTLDGTIPVRVVGDDVLIEGAHLASREPGQLRYLPDGAPTGLGADDASIDLVLAALSNFHYDRLDVDLSRAAGGETEVGLHIAGSNPDLYDGYPIELNVNLTGELDRIVRDSLAGYRIPDEIKERLSGF